MELAAILAEENRSLKIIGLEKLYNTPNLHVDKLLLSFLSRIQNLINMLYIMWSCRCFLKANMPCNSQTFYVRKKEISKMPCLILRIIYVLSRNLRFEALIISTKVFPISILCWLIKLTRWVVTQPYKALLAPCREVVFVKLRNIKS